jgi:hypothetical protein
MIYIRHLGAVPDDTTKDFDAARIRTHALTLATEALHDNVQAARHFLNRRRPTAYRAREIHRFG